MMQGPNSTARKPRTRTLPRDQRRASILEGATRAFARGGFAATSMEEIAVSCGVTAPIVYRHFESKEQLYRAVLESIGEGLRDSLPNPAAPFGIDLEAFLSAARADPDGFHLFWVHAAREPEFSAYADELRERAVAAVGKALKGRVPKSMREWSAHAIVGFAVEGLLNWLQYGDPREDARILAATEGALRAGVRAWATESPRKRRSS